jgi:predicted nucleic acid-binding protein
MVPAMDEVVLPAFLDTSYVVRYLTDDPPDMAEIAARIIDSERRLILSEIVLAESAYVLTSVYRISRAPVVDALMSFVQRRNIHLLNLTKPRALEALRLCRDSKRYSFVDVLLRAEALEVETPRIYTFDKRFPTHGLELFGADDI